VTVRVLLVDDNEVNRYLAQYLLERAGCVVTLAANGVEALAAARLHKPDLVLMDIRMPLMDGYEATTRMKNDPELAAVPVVALSANAMPQEKARALEVGCLAHIEKPIDVTRFIEQLSELLPGRFTAID
jgi:CheY-like chemotaxis protein